MSRTLLLVSLMMVHAPALAQMQPRDPRPVDREKATAASAASREAELTASIASNPGSMRPRLELATLQEDSGRFAAAEETLRQARQWEFTPTHLNGVPVPVIMTVTLNFTGQ